MKNDLKNELHNILSGKSEVRFGTVIQAIASYLNDGKKASPTFEVEKHFKKQEAEKLEKYISENNLWIKDIDFSQYVSEGAEQKVYLKDSEHVLKLNGKIIFITYYYITIFFLTQHTNSLDLPKTIRFYMQL